MINEVLQWFAIGILAIPRTVQVLHDFKQEAQDEEDEEYL